MSKYANDCLLDDLIFVLGLNTDLMYGDCNHCKGNISYAVQGAAYFLHEVIKSFIMEAGPYMPDNRDWFFDDLGKNVSADFKSEYFAALVKDCDEFFPKEALLEVLARNVFKLIPIADFKSYKDQGGFTTAWKHVHQLFNIGD